MTAVNEVPTGVELSPVVAWSRRVRRVGGLIQLAFAAFWLVRGALSIGGGPGTALASAHRGVHGPVQAGNPPQGGSDGAQQPSSRRGGGIGLNGP